MVENDNENSETAALPSGDGHPGAIRGALVSAAEHLNQIANQGVAVTRLLSGEGWAEGVSAGAVEAQRLIAAAVADLQECANKVHVGVEVAEVLVKNPLATRASKSSLGLS